jgi:hypothetical protein
MAICSCPVRAICYANTLRKCEHRESDEECTPAPTGSSISQVEQKGAFQVSITWWSQLIWLFALALGSFLVTWIFTDLLRFARTAYIGVLTVVTAGFLFGYLSWSNADWGAFISYQWFWGLVGAVITGPLLVAIMVQGARRAHSRVLALTPRPEGLHLAATLLWEGVVYGIDEGLLLSVLPVLMTWQALSVLGWTQSWLGVVFSGAVALVASVFDL